MPCWVHIALLALLAACGGSAATPAFDGGPHAQDGGAADGGTIAADGGAADGGTPDAGTASPDGGATLLDTRPLFHDLAAALARETDPARRSALIDRFEADLEARGGFPPRGGDEAIFVYRGTARTSLSVAGTFNDWTPGRDRMTPVSGTDLHAAIVRVGRAARAEYKFVDGDSWFQDPRNRLAAWDGIDRRGRGEFNSVLLMPEHLPERGVLHREPGSRAVWVYLPRGYLRDRSLRLPTLIVHDGNESITRAQMDLVAESLMLAGEIPEMLLVFVDVEPSRRIYEYTTGEGSGGDAYVDYLQGTLVPAIEARYGALPERRGLAGASLGGLISYHAARRHPGFWTRIGGQSPSFWWDSMSIVAAYRDGPIVPGRFYFDSGYPGDASTGARAMRDAMEARGYTFRYLEDPGAAHDWPYWRERFDDLLRTLYAPTPP